VRKSDGGFGYNATDLAAIRYRFVECDCDRAVYVVDAGQLLLNLVYGGAKRAGRLAGGTHAGSGHACAARSHHAAHTRQDDRTNYCSSQNDGRATTCIY
jgi:hypothetical protein